MTVTTANVDPHKATRPNETRARRRTRALGAVSVAAITAMLFAGCSAAPTAEVTPTLAPVAEQKFINPTVSAPETAEQAVADATATFVEYRKLYDYVLTHKGAGAEQAVFFMTTDASYELDATAVALSDGTITASGNQSYRIIGAVAGENMNGETILPFQAVAVSTCYDNAEVKISIQGDQVELPPVEQFDAILTFEPDANTWRVSSTHAYTTPNGCS